MAANFRLFLRFAIFEKKEKILDSVSRLNWWLLFSDNSEIQKSNFTKTLTVYSFSTIIGVLLYVHFSKLYLFFNISVYTPIQGTNREKYLNH